VARGVLGMWYRYGCRLRSRSSKALASHVLRPLDSRRRKPGGCRPAWPRNAGPRGWPAGTQDDELTFRPPVPDRLRAAGRTDPVHIPGYGAAVRASTEAANLIGRWRDGHQVAGRPARAASATTLWRRIRLCESSSRPSPQVPSCAVPGQDVVEGRSPAGAPRGDERATQAAALPLLQKTRKFRHPVIGARELLKN